METDKPPYLQAAIMLLYAATVSGAFGYFLVALSATSLTFLSSEIDLEFFLRLNYCPAAKNR